MKFNDKIFGATVASFRPDYENELVFWVFITDKEKWDKDKIVDDCSSKELFEAMDEKGFAVLQEGHWEIPTEDRLPLPPCL